PALPGRPEPGRDRRRARHPGGHGRLRPQPGPPAARRDTDADRRGGDVVIPENDLYALRRVSTDRPPRSPRPLEAVLARGPRLRPRRLALRVAAMAVLAVAVVAVSVGPALGRRSDPTAKVAPAGPPPDRPDLLSGVPCPETNALAHAGPVTDV